MDEELIRIEYYGLNPDGLFAKPLTITKIQNKAKDLETLIRPTLANRDVGYIEVMVSRRLQLCYALFEMEFCLEAIDKLMQEHLDGLRVIDEISIPSNLHASDAMRRNLERLTKAIRKEWGLDKYDDGEVARLFLFCKQLEEELTIAKDAAWSYVDIDDIDDYSDSEILDCSDSEAFDPQRQDLPKEFFGQKTDCSMQRDDGEMDGNSLFECTIGNCGLPTPPGSEHA